MKNTVIKKEEVIGSQWARNITVRRGAEDLDVYGECFRGSENLLDRYELETLPPHLEFANCQSDEGLIAFVGKYGPVVASEASERHLDQDPDRFDKTMNSVLSSGVPWPSDRFAYVALLEEVDRRMAASPVPSTQRHAVQKLDELRREHDLFRTAVGLTEKLMSYPVPPDDDASAQEQGEQVANEEEISAMEEIVAFLEKLASITKAWEQQFAREQVALRSKYRILIPQWYWSQDEQKEMELRALQARDALKLLNQPGSVSMLGVLPPKASGQAAMCTLLNAFPLKLTWYGQFLMEAPPFDLLRGIRPILFAMLRRDVQTKRGVKRCAREGCPNFFVVSRIDKKCCSIDCSKRDATKRHYLGKRKVARQKVAAKLAKKKLETKAGTKRGR